MAYVFNKQKLYVVSLDWCDIVEVDVDIIDGGVY